MGVTNALSRSLGESPLYHLIVINHLTREHTIRTSAVGIVEAIYFQVEDTVEADAQLLQIGDVDEG